MKGAAFDAFYREHYERLLRFVSRRLADPEAAKDVCTECFVIAWQKFDPAAPFPKTWLYQTARNNIGNAYQKREREQQMLARLREQAGLDTETGEITHLADALAKLSEIDQEVLRLTYWEHLSGAEIAAVLGCSEQAAWKRVDRARDALRGAMLRLTTGGGAT